MSRLSTTLSLVSIALLVLLPSRATLAQDVLNNDGSLESYPVGNFTDGQYWYHQVADANDVTVSIVDDPVQDGDVALSIDIVEFVSGNLQFMNQAIDIDGPGTYRISSYARASDAGAQMQLVGDHQGGSYAWFGNQTFTLTEDWAEYTIEFDVPEESGDVAVTQIRANHILAYAANSGNTVYIDNVRVVKVEDDVEEPPVANTFAFGFESLDRIDSWVNTNVEPGLELSLSDESVEGDHSLEFAYDFVADRDWGGSVDIGVSAPGEFDVFADMTDAAGISFWYNVTEPINSAQHASFAIKLVDISDPDPEEGNELWEYRSTALLTDDSGEWHELRIPFDAFTVPSWAYQGNGQLDLDQIGGFEMQVIIGGDAQGSQFAGTFLLDDLKLYEAEPPVDNTFAFGFESLDDIGHWVNSSSEPGLVLDLSDDRVEGESSLSFGYNFIADEDWGGSVDIGVEAPGETGLYADLSDADGVTFRYKVISASSSTADAAFAIKLVDASGADEEGDDEEDEEEGPVVEHWEYRTTLLLTDDSGEWQELQIPFGSFTLPSWGVQGNGTLDLDQISGFEMQVVVGGSGIGNTYTGEFLVDALALYTEGEEPVDPVDPDYPRPPHAFGDVLNINGSFELEEVGPASGVTAWSLTTNSVTPMDIISDSQDDDGRALRFDFEWDSAAAETYNVEAVSEPFYPGEGDVIRASVWLRSDTDGAVAMLYLGLPESGSWARRPGYGQEMNVTLSTEWQEFVYPDYTVIAADISHADESMRFGISLNFEENDGAQIDIDNMRVRKVDLSDSNEGRLAHEFSLKSAYPNPFSGSTTIEYSLDAAGPVSIQVFNLLGQQVATLVDEVQGAGAHRATLDARDFAAGVYIYRITAGDKTDSKTMMVVR